MNELQKTLAFAGAAVVLALLAFLTAPSRPEAAAFADQGRPFYPEFKDPRKAASLEVGEYNDKLARIQRFKVALAGGKWSIPSHHGYPADAKDRLGKVAASMIDLKKETLRSERPQDHEALGVIDPLDENAGAAGRGRRVTLKDAGGVVLADFIFGKETKDGSGTRYVRVPDQKKTYAIKTKIEISTKFEDWIETDLLQVSQAAIRKITIDNYSIGEKGIKDRTTYFLSRDDGGAAWKVTGIKETEEPNAENIGTMLGALDDLKIAGIRAKPAFLTEDIRKSGDFKLVSRDLTQEQFASLQALKSKGYHMAPIGDEIQMLSNEGELQVSCDDGIVYTLRFGGLVVGEGEALTAGDDDAPKDPKKAPEKGGTEGRYLFVTAKFDDAMLAAPGAEPVAPPGYKPEEKKDEKKEDKKDEKKQDSPEVEKYKKDKEEHDRKKADREKKAADGKKRAQELTDRFADWYYVISADYFKKLRKDQKDLVKAKEVPKEEKKPEEKKPDEPKKPDDKKPDEPKKPEEKKPEEPKKPKKKKP